MMILVSLLGGLGLFIAGMNMMSRGVERVAGDRLRSILEAFTKTRLLGLFVGLFFTAMIQSSSAATVMVVSFVNSGLMQLSQACGIILGANIGTTVTALLVAFKLSTVAPIFIFTGALMMYYVKQPVIRKSGEIIMGFGILFLGISTMSAAMTELREMPGVIDVLAKFTNPFLGFLLGFVVTSVVQSSSVTVSILVVMGSQGLIGLDICLFVILGCNVGSCTTALMAAIGGSKNAMRAAMIHLLFNIFGTILMFTLLIFFMPQIVTIIHAFSGSGADSGTLGRNIAMAHFLFKAFQVAALYPFMNLIIKLTYAIVKGEDVSDEEKLTVQYIGDESPNPAVAAYMAVQEMQRMAQMAIANLNLAVEALLENDEAKAAQVARTERYIDFLDEKISTYLVRINQLPLPFEDISLIAAYFHVVNDIERIGDHAESIIELMPQLSGSGIRISEEASADLREMMVHINKILEYSIHMFATGDASYMNAVAELEDRIDHLERSLHGKHVARLAEGKCTAMAGVSFSDAVSGLERVADHATNIAFSLLEAKGLRQAHS